MIYILIGIKIILNCSQVFLASVLKLEVMKVYLVFINEFKLVYGIVLQ